MIVKLACLPVVYMTAQAEGYTYVDGTSLEGDFVEALARNYWEPYDACSDGGTGVCSSSKLYMFMSGYQVWFGGHVDDLLGTLSMTAGREDLLGTPAQMGRIQELMEYPGDWRSGKKPDQPWQWHNWWRAPGLRKSKDGRVAEAIGWVSATGGQFGDYFWIMTADQDYYFKYCIKDNLAWCSGK